MDGASGALPRPLRGPPLEPGGAAPAHPGARRGHVPRDGPRGARPPGRGPHRRGARVPLPGLSRGARRRARRDLPGRRPREDGGRHQRVRAAATHLVPRPDARDVARARGRRTRGRAPYRGSPVKGAKTSRPTRATGPGPEKVVLVGVFKKAAGGAADEVSLSELGRLVETAGGVVAGSLVQRVDRYNPASLMGPGKVDEVAALARNLGARTVVVDEDLSPAQQLTLEDRVGAKVVDRTRLILDIFARRARTREGELQIELAQLSYMMPRLTGSWRQFSQQVGGIGTRGPGERKLEYERRHMARRIDHIKGQLEKARTAREVQRRRRETVPVPSVAIIGYTNAGKSSLLNRLVGAGAVGRPGEVYADDKLFATLDATTRRVALPGGGWCVFTDTVGFIQKLPTTLVAAFRSTLEETVHADCHILLEDGLAPDPGAQKATVDKVLAELGASGIPRVTAVSKADAIGDDARRRLCAADPERILLSAKTGEGVADALARVQQVLGHRWLLREVRVPPGRSALLGELHRSAMVVGRDVEGDSVVLRLRVTAENWDRLRAKLSD
ncbi:GTPase HflX [bacterium]|nr:MAG: GTPase HflX [bacterium]